MSVSLLAVDDEAVEDADEGEDGNGVAGGVAGVGGGTAVLCQARAVILESEASRVPRQPAPWRGCLLSTAQLRLGIMAPIIYGLRAQRVGDAKMPKTCAW